MDIKKYIPFVEMNVSNLIIYLFIYLFIRRKCVEMATKVVWYHSKRRNSLKTPLVISFLLFSFLTIQVDLPGCLAKLIDQVALYPKWAEGARARDAYNTRYPFGKAVG